VVEQVVYQAPARLQELIEMGADFDRSDSGTLLLGREGGHTANRIIHCRSPLLVEEHMF
jgi:L-aspartate oxidase